MPQTIRHEPVRFINAEPHVENGTAFVVLSFGGEEGPIEDRSVSVAEAEQLVMDTLKSLAAMGDPLAQEINLRYFTDDEAHP